MGVSETDRFLCSLFSWQGYHRLVCVDTEDAQNSYRLRHREQRKCGKVAIFEP